MNRLLSFGCFVALAVAANNASAATIFESGTLGPTGLAQGSVAATNINSNVFTGVRFQLSQSVITTQVGGHFVSQSNGIFFGAVVKLESENDFPNSNNLSTSDVLGTSTLTFPSPSAEVFGNLNLSLEPGWYALVFGSGLFGTSGDGAAPRNNLDLGNPTYIGWQPGTGWLDLTSLSTIFQNHRFVVLGDVVPECASSILMIVAALLLSSKTRWRKMNSYQSV